MDAQTMCGEQPDREPAPPDDLTDVDLYCLHCGYNLRGLSGDPRRCPECGQFSPISEMTLPAEAITRQLRRMESAPTACIVLALLMLIGLATGLLVLVSVGPSALGCMCCFLSRLFSLIFWLESMERFRSACMGRPGWSEVLFEYHLHGVGVCLILIVSFAMPLFFGLQPQGPRSSWLVSAGVVLCAAGCVGVIVLAPRVRRRCKARMDVLQREVAVKIAGEHLRERLSRRHW